MATIKAGTYEFNLDTLTVPTFTKDVVIPFTDFANDTFSGMKFETTEASVFTLTYYTDTAEELAYTNDASSGWVGWQSTKYQTITIAKDTTVDADFYSWFNANIRASGGGDTPDEPTTPTKKFTRLYLGDVAYSSGGKCFKRLTTEQPQPVLAAGLYDADDNLVASWDTLVNTYGLNCEKDYTFQSCKTDTACPYYILKNKSELASVVRVVIDGSVANIGTYTFAYCDNLTSIVISDGVTSIGRSAFYYCSSLNNITIPDSVTSIGSYAFSNCYRLTSIVIPDGVTSIGAETFYYCFDLTSIVIPDSVTSIGSYAFRECTSLTSIVIPDSVTTIEAYAFKDCSAIKDVYYMGSSEQWAGISIGTNNTSLTKATIHYNYTGE